MLDSFLSALASIGLGLFFYVQTVGLSIYGIFLGALAMVTSAATLVLSAIFLCGLIVIGAVGFIISVILLTLLTILKSIIAASVFVATIVIASIGLLLAIVVGSGQALFFVVGMPLRSLMNSTVCDSAQVDLYHAG